MGRGQIVQEEECGFSAQAMTLLSLDGFKQGNDEVQFSFQEIIFMIRYPSSGDCYNIFG